VRARIEELAPNAPVMARDAVRLLSPVANPGKFVCGAGNWQHHGAPFGMIAFASTAMTLFPADIIMSGAADVAPVGVGDVMKIEIAGLGAMVVPVTLSPYARVVG
jgi:hypothetical protein